MDLIVNSLNRIATPMMREQAEQVIYLDAAGHGTKSIASEIGVKWPVVKVIRTVTGNCLIEEMRANGYSSTEIIRTLGVATDRVTGVAVAA